MEQNNNKQIIGFYPNVQIDEVIKAKIKNNDLTFCANYWITDKGDKYGNKHGYSYIYENIFKNIKTQQINLLEIGAARGSSLKMWDSWFDNISIDSLDINKNCNNLCENYDNINIILTDAKIYVPNKKYDIIIDDGSHLANDIIMSFHNLWESLKIGGIYVIEDMDSCKSIEYIKLFLNNLNENSKYDKNEIDKNTYYYLDLFINIIKTDTDKNILYHDEKIIFIQKKYKNTDIDIDTIK